MLIEFGPGDAEGTAGCTSADFVDVMYENGYSLWEWGYRVPREVLEFENIPAAINGTGRRVFESVGSRVVRQTCESRLTPYLENLRDAYLDIAAPTG
jgi:hypothetical protein